MKSKTVTKRFQLFVSRLALIPLAWFFSSLKWAQAETVGNLVGDIAFFVSRGYRNQALKNISMAFGGQMTEPEISKMARRVFRNFSRSFIEFFIAPKLTDNELRKLMPIHGLEHLSNAISAGNGAVLITAHLGNWELLARRIVQEGFSLSVIARDSDDPTSNRIVNRVRQSGGYKVLSRDNAVGPAIRSLRKNEVLGILPDQNTWGACVFTDFFGKPAATAIGPAVLSIRTNARILVAFSHRAADGSYRGVIYPPLNSPNSGNREADTAALVQAYTSAIEEEIRKYPDQWLWVHNRWKRKPAPDHYNTR